MPTPLISIEKIRKSYGKTEVLKGISFTIQTQEIVGLLGVNGAGKTTLSSIIASLHPADDGSILYRGQSIYDDITAYRRHIGYCQQKANLHPLLTIKENLMYAGRFYNLDDNFIMERIAFLAKELSLTKYLDYLPEQLSGGYKQRVMIARSLIHEPSLVIFDEPTSALDPHIRRQLWELIKHLKSLGISILLTTHYLDEAEYLSDRVCLLDKGVIRLIDTPENLKQSFAKAKLEDVFIHLTQEQNQE